MRGNPAWSATRAMEEAGLRAQRELGVKVTLHAIERHATASARNKLVIMMLDQSKCSHLWFVDDDTVCPHDALVKLLALERDADADIATGVTPAFIHKPRSGNGNGRFAPTGTPQKYGIGVNIQTERGRFLPCWPVGRFPIIAAGTSCMLIRRRVFEQIEHPWFNYFESRAGAQSTEDIPFCDKAREAGLSLWCDASVICDHIKEIGLLCVAPEQPSDEQHQAADQLKEVSRA